MHNSSYSRLPSQTETDVSSASPDPRRRQLARVLAVTLISTAVVASLSLVVLILAGRPNPPPGSPARQASYHALPSTAVEQEAFYWTNGMLSWQRTAYHFQPEKNWMNDPSAPMYYKGWYHLFYQYNPYAATWGNISWGHAVSKDLIHWLYLPLAMVPDSWFDINGVWTGSATLLPDGRIVVLYTGITADNIQVQNLAYPANVSDPLLLRWIKYPGNPTIVPPPGTRDFRDPSTAWRSSDGTWRVMIGSKKHEAGTSLVYHTTNFSSYEPSDGVLHGVPGTGMWECVDFYPVSTSTENGLDTSANGPGIKHVLKGSTGGGDYYAIGKYDPVEEKWTPDDPSQDVGIGLRLDYGSFYASKTFFDQSTGRRILWGWVPETDSPADDLSKTWASLQAIPRVVVLDNKTGTNLLQWPVEEVESLRLNSSEFNAVKVPAGSVVPLEVGPAAELDIVAEFQVEKEALEATVEVGDVSYNCSSGAGTRGALGPFGFLVIATDTLSERTPIYFYIAKHTNGHLQTFFCADQTRSSKAMDVGTKRFGSQIPILNDENFSMRLLVDHSIVESYGQGGRTCITSRIYPTEAIFGATRLFIFNNATAATVTASIKVWQMNSTFFHAL